MNDKLRLLKYQVKTNPTILLKKPLLLAFLPYWGCQSVLRRLKNCTTVVYLTESDIDKISRKESDEDSGLKCEVIRDPGEFAKYARGRMDEDREVGLLYLEEVNRRFSRGDFSIVGLTDGHNPISYVFICTRNAVFSPVNMTLPLPQGIFGMYDVYTYERFRGKGHYSRLFGLSVQIMRSQSYKKMWLWLMAHNQASIQVHLSLGIERISKILMEKIKFGITKRTAADVEMPLAGLVNKR